MAKKAMWFGLLAFALAAVGCGGGGGGGVKIPGSANRTVPGSGSKPSEWMQGHWRWVHNQINEKSNPPQPEEETSHAYIVVLGDSVSISHEYADGSIEKESFTIRNQNKKTGVINGRHDKFDRLEEWVVTKDGVMKDIRNNFNGEGDKLTEVYYRVGNELEP